MSKSSLSSVVSNLVRASMGSSISDNVTDEDLDRHVAELILKEAKQKGERYNTDGIRAYLNNGMSDSNAPKTNKRFLSSIIRNTDDHNKTILRAQALAVQEVKREREEQERRERRARAEEAVAAERTRRFMGRARSDDSDRWDRRDSERKRKRRCWETRDDDEEVFEKERRQESDRRRRRHRHRSRSDERSVHREERRSSRSARHHDEDRVSSRHKRDRSREDEEDYIGHRHRSHGHGSSHRRRWHRSRSASPRRHKSKRRSRSETLTDPDDASEGVMRKPSSDDREAELRRKLQAKYKLRDDVEQKTCDDGGRLRSPSRSPIADPPPKRRRTSPKPESSSSRTARSPSSGSSMSCSPSPPSRSNSHTSQLPSKMDKYFEESYDPRLDVAPLAAPKVPTTGLIGSSEFEGWDAMLELIRMRREDKEEKKRLERMGLGKDTKEKKGKASGVASINDRWQGGSENIMEIEYKKKGSVREWDMGKEGF